MSPMDQNSWMQITGWTLAHFVWQGGLIALMVGATLRLGRRWPSQTRYVIACGGLVAMLVVPIATALVLSSTSPRSLMTLMVSRVAMGVPGFGPSALTDATPEVSGDTSLLVSEPSGGPSVDVAASATDTGDAGMQAGGANSWLPVVVWSWCIGVMLLLGRMAVRLHGVRRLRHTALGAVPAPLRTVCYELALRLGVRVPFRVAASTAVDSPTVIGWWRPVILLPIAALANLSPVQVEMILAHELAHIRRHDYLVNLLQTVVETFLFYHPAVWWVSGRLRAEREDACDDIALGVCGDPVDYAAALNELEALRGRDCALALGAAQGSLVARVRRILRVPAEAAPRSPGWVTTMLLGVVFATGVVGMADLPSLGRGGAATAVIAVEEAPQPPPVRQQPQDFDWRVHETDHFDIYHYPALEEHLEEVAGYAERAYDQISADLTHNLPGRVSEVVFKTHSEFEQSNIVPGGNADRIGSFSTPTWQRIVLPIDEPADQLHRLMVHELTHQFAFDIIPRNVTRSGVPLWVDEGLADYMAGVWQPLDLMAVRDAALSDIVPRMSEFVDYGGFTNARVAYNLGHAAFEFIEDRWGKPGVRRFLFSLRDVIAGGGGDVYADAFSLSAAAFDDAFESYIRDRFQAFRDKERPGDYGRDLAPDPVDTLYLAVVSVEPSPSGDLIAAFAQNRRDQDMDIVLLNTENGEVVRNLTQGENQDLGFESFAIPGRRWNTVPWMSWSSVGDRLAYFVRTGDHRSLALHNVVTGEVEEIVDLTRVDQPESPDMSPDGRRVAFSALQGVVGDIYLLDLETRALTNLTDDGTADYAPTFSPDGAFLVYLARVGGNNKLFRLDLDTQEKTQLTFGAFSDAAAQFVDDHTLVFASTATDPGAPMAPDVAPGGDVFNIWTLDLDSGQLRRSTRRPATCRPSCSGVRTRTALDS